MTGTDFSTNPTHQNPKISDLTQPNPWDDPTHGHVWSVCFKSIFKRNHADNTIKQPQQTDVNVIKNSSQELTTVNLIIKH
jgi:hypothetical protein